MGNHENNTASRESSNNIFYAFQHSLHPISISTDLTVPPSMRFALFLFPFLLFRHVILDPIPVEQLNPCYPSPCGANAQCTVRNSAGACTCTPEFFGNPYEGCRPECIMNSDCPLNRACFRNKCQNPCQGLCGPNAECRVTNHLPSCSCLIGYLGDPYSYCNVQRDERKKIIIEICPLRFFSTSCKISYPTLIYVLTTLRSIRCLTVQTFIIICSC